MWIIRYEHCRLTRMRSETSLSLFALAVRSIAMPTCPILLLSSNMSDRYAIPDSFLVLEHSGLCYRSDLFMSHFLSISSGPCWSRCWHRPQRHRKRVSTTPSETISIDACQWYRCWFDHSNRSNRTAYLLSIYRCKTTGVLLWSTTNVSRLWK